MVESFFGTALVSGFMPNPIAQKITPDHITQIITAQAQDSQASYADRKDSRRVVGGLLGLGSCLATIVIVVLALNNNTETLNEMVKVLAIFVGGAGSGYGISEFRRSR
jgi:hypothetical protein